MAGHSKFKNIMYRKGAQDKKRSALFSKLSREITVAAKMGLPDPDANARLRLGKRTVVSATKHPDDEHVDAARGGNPSCLPCHSHLTTPGSQLPVPACHRG